MGSVASNFINGPMGANGSKNIKAIVPIQQQAIADLIPKTKKQPIQTMLIRSMRAIPHGNLGMNAAENETTTESAPKVMAPATSSAGENGFFLDIHNISREIFDTGEERDRTCLINIVFLLNFGGFRSVIL